MVIFFQFLHIYTHIRSLQTFSGAHCLKCSAAHKRERDRDRQTETETDRQTDRDGQTDRQTDRQADRENSEPYYTRIKTLKAVAYSCNLSQLVCMPTGYI